MPGIVSVGFVGGPAVEGGEVAAFPAPLSREGMDLLTDVVAAAIEQQGHVIAIYPRWSPEPSLQRLETVRSVLETRRLVLHPSDLPPLAGAVFASLASAVAAYVPSPGVLLGGLPRLQSELVVLAWLGSVARLRHLPVSVAQHMASWWPGTAFEAVLSPEPVVTRLGRRDRGVPLPGPAVPLRLAVASREGDVTWVREVVVPALGQPPVEELPPTPLGPQWWGARRLVEVVAYPADVPALAGRVTVGVDWSLCSWCGETVASDPCPFCRLSAGKARAGVAR